MFYLGELGTATLMVAATAVAIIALGTLLDAQKTAHRVLLLTVSTLLGLRYIVWRATETLPPADFSASMFAGYTFLLLEAVAMLSAVSANVLMSKTLNRSSEADRHANWWGNKPPRVAVMIATYNEGVEILERSVIGATAIDYPNYEVYLLDDGNRPEIEAFAREHGVHYVTRPDNTHAKAGNINHALRKFDESGDPPDFVTILDADFVPHQQFLNRAMALFHAEDVALVQTPQHFFNPDPIQHNLGLIHAYPDEQRYFFDHLQQARDAWGIAICCGTSSISRWEPLKTIGFFPTESVTEDFLLTLTFAERGWRTVYLNEPLSEGLAPEGIEEYITQRARWCLGLVQIARSRLGPLSRNDLPFMHRWSVADSVLYWAGSYPFRLATFVVPLLYWYFNLLVVNADLVDVVDYFGMYFVWAVLTVNFLTRGTQLPFLTEVSMLLPAIPITVSAWSGLFNPNARSFKVTAKGGDRSRRVVQWQLMRPFLILFALTAFGVLLGVMFDDFAHFDAADGKAVVMFWSVWNLIVLILTMAVCVERPREEVHITEIPRRGVAIFGEVEIPIIVSGVTSEGAFIHGVDGDVGDELLLEIEDMGHFLSTCQRPTPGGMHIQFDHTPVSRRQILVSLHTTDRRPSLEKADLVQIVAESVFGDALRDR